LTFYSICWELCSRNWIPKALSYPAPMGLLVLVYLAIFTDWSLMSVAFSVWNYMLVNLQNLKVALLPHLNKTFWVVALPLELFLSGSPNCTIHLFEIWFQLLLPEPTDSVLAQIVPHENLQGFMFMACRVADRTHLSHNGNNRNGGVEEC
jgi:hypothetical protein